MDLSLLRVQDASLLKVVRQHCEAYHYLQRWPDPRSLPFAYAMLTDGKLYAPDGRLNGLLVFKKLQHHKQKGLFGYEGLPTAWQVLDLARVWINPHWQQPGLHLFSRAVESAMERIQRDWLYHHPPVFPHLPYHLELIVSYADHRYHKGHAYQACHFKKWKPGREDMSLYYKRLPVPDWTWRPEMAYEDLPLLKLAI